MTFLVTGCASVAPVVKVGLIAPFEGRYREVGYDAIYSARLAVREINEAGGIGGYRVALVALDDSSDPEQAQQAAASLAIDPDVVAVAGHWRPETSAAAEDIYAAVGLPLLELGRPPFVESDPDQLPGEFRQAYEAVTPFDEVAGGYAAATYDAFQLVRLALAEAQQSAGTIDRASVREALSSLEHHGLTGTVYQP
jgi:ABC-type branched-subunit amino acid transport system substrate-binding protein